MLKNSYNIRSGCEFNSFIFNPFKKFRILYEFFSKCVLKSSKMWIICEFFKDFLIGSFSKKCWFVILSLRSRRRIHKFKAFLYKFVDSSPSLRSGAEWRMAFCLKSILFWKRAFWFLEKSFIILFSLLINL